MKQTDVKYEAPPQPRQLRLDTTTRCNARCVSCHHFLSKREGEMSLGMIDDILDDVFRWREPLHEIVPVNYGEFFMREDWYLILTMIANKLPKTRMVIPTNGSFLDCETVQKLCRFPKLDFLNISVNAYFEDTYDQFTGLPAKTLKTIKQAIALVTVLRPDICLSISMVFDPQYHTDLERDYFKNYWQKYLPQILPAASAGRPQKKPIIKTKVPCRSIFSDFVVGFDRKLSSCCFDAGFQIDLGEYTGDLIKDWHNEKLTELRRLHNEHRRNEIDLCGRCTSA